MTAVAIDVICVSGENSLESTEFYIKFFNVPIAVDGGDLELLGFTRHSQSLNVGMGISIANPSSDFRSLIWVNIIVNGVICEYVHLFIGPENKACFFDPDTRHYSNQPTLSQLKRLGLHFGRNQILVGQLNGEYYASFEIWMYKYTDKLVVMDIDGTVTKSDVRGYFETVYRGVYTFVHEGVSSFISFLEMNQNLNILYITARPIVHINETRSLISSLSERLSNSDLASQLRGGPIFTNRHLLLKAAYGELIARTSASFKGGICVGIVQAFLRAGSQQNPFVLGIGNRETDARAYRSAGIGQNQILIINTRSHLSVWSGPQSWFASSRRLESPSQSTEIVSTEGRDMGNSSTENSAEAQEIDQQLEPDTDSAYDPDAGVSMDLPPAPRESPFGIGPQPASPSLLYSPKESPVASATSNIVKRFQSYSDNNLRLYIQHLNVNNTGFGWASEYPIAPSVAAVIGVLENQDFEGGDGETALAGTFAIGEAISNDNHFESRDDRSIDVKFIE